MSMNRLEEAMDCIEESINLEPHNATCHYIKGFILLHINNYEEAIVSFEQCLDLNPGYSDAVMQMGFAQYKKGDYANSLQ